MDAQLTDQIKESLANKSIEDLVIIWSRNDRDEWSEEAFLVIEQILKDNKVPLPPQQEYKPDGKPDKIFSFRSRARWYFIFVHFATGFFSGTLGLTSNPGLYSALLMLLAGVMFYISLHLILGLRIKGIRAASVLIIVLFLIHEAVLLIYAPDHRFAVYITFFSLLMIINELALFVWLKRGREDF